jgi:DnaK suppressor protein
MNKKEMDKFKKLLLEKRDDLTQVVKAKKEQDMTDTEIGDEIDTASQTSEKELLFELADNEKVILDAIESALRRIEKGTYGVCESCRQKVSEARLKAIPWVRYCIDCQSKAERPR